MTAPGPLAGRNPYTGAYQTKQYDDSHPAKESPLHALADPPTGALEATASPSKLFLENTDPPVGAGGTVTPVVPGT